MRSKNNPDSFASFYSQSEDIFFLKKKKEKYIILICYVSSSENIKSPKGTINLSVSPECLFKSGQFEHVCVNGII